MIEPQSLEGRRARAPTNEDARFEAVQMRILYHHRIASKDGQYVHVSEIVSSLRTLGTDLQMVAPKFSEGDAFGAEGGIVAKLKKQLPKALYEFLELGYSFVDFCKMVAGILRFRPDVIYERYQIFMPSGVLAAKLFRIPLLLEVNAPLFDERSNYGGLGLPALARWSEGFVWRNASVVLPVTGVLARMVQSRGVQPARIRVIPNGVNDEQFLVPASARAIPALRPGQIVVGFVGFCREWHELDKVVRLIAEDASKNLFFLIVGDGPVIPSLKQQVAEMGCSDRVHFAGLVGRSEMPGWLAAIDIAIQPAVVPYASPLKLIEYLAAGKAIVAPAQENIRELLEHEQNALLFTEGHTGQLIAAIRRFAGDRELRRRLSAAARETIERKQLLWRHNAQRIIDLAADLKGA